MRYLIIITFFFGFAFATSQIESEHFIILYENPEMAEYAQKVAAEAEWALEILSPVFTSPKDKIIIRFDTSTDIFNASATPFPRSAMVFRTVRSGSFKSVFTVVVHELSHIKQLGFTDGVDGKRGLLLGLELATGFEDIAAVAPAWFIEGIATWIESHYGIDGRLYDSKTTELIDSLALADNWPSLDSLSLANLEAWPSGSARYYLGVRFIDYLVQKYSFEHIVELLKNYNSSYYKDSFSQNWQKVTGSSLFEEYSEWSKLTKENALKRKEASQIEFQLSQTGGYKTALAISPNGKKIVYSRFDIKEQKGHVILAEYDGQNITNQRTFASNNPRNIVWLDDNSIIYNRIFKLFDEKTYFDLFSFDLTTNTETRLTNQARAQFPQIYDGCIYYAQNLVVGGSSIKKLCQGETTTVYKLEFDEAYINSLSISPNGQIALIMIFDNADHIAVLKDNKLEILEASIYAGQLAWQNEQKLLLVSKQSGIDNLYSYDLETAELRQLSDSFAGVLKFSQAKNRIVYLSFTGDGYDILRLEPKDITAAWLRKTSRQLELHYDPYPVSDYNPIDSLLPYGWYPDISITNNPFAAGLGVNILAQDYSDKHSYLLNLGYRFSDQNPGPYFAANYTYKDNLLTINSSITKKRALPELNFGIRRNIPIDQNWIVVGANAHSSVDITNFGLKPDFGFYASFTAVKASANNKRGFAFGLTSTSDIRNELLYTRVSGYSNYYYPLNQLGLAGNLSFGLEMSSDFEKLFPVNFNLAYSYQLPIELRYDDGLYALESIQISPSISTAYDFANASIKFSSNLGLSANFMLFYNLPLSYGVNIPIYASEYKFTVKTNLPLKSGF